MALSQVSPLKSGVVQFNSVSVPGDYVTLYTAGTYGSRCYALTTTNSDTTAQHVVSVQRFIGTAGYDGTAILSVQNAGYGTGSPPQNMMWSALPVDECGNPYIQLAPGETLQATFKAPAIPAGMFLNVAVTAVDYGP